MRNPSFPHQWSSRADSWTMHAALVHMHSKRAPKAPSAASLLNCVILMFAGQLNLTARVGACGYFSDFDCSICNHNPRASEAFGA